MPKRVLERIIEEDPEVCCPYGYFLVRQHMPTADLARETGLTTRNIRYWRRKVKLGKIVCHQLEPGICNQFTLDTIDILLPVFHDSD